MVKREKVFIVGRTRAGSMLCIGAMALHGLKSMRLKRNSSPPYWFCDSCPFDVGGVFEIDYVESPDPNNPHHREDVVVYRQNCTGHVDFDQVIEVLDKNNMIFKGSSPIGSFQHSGFHHPMRRAQSGAFYIPEGELENLMNSTSFWICDSDLVLENTRYANRRHNYSIKYVGEENPVEVIQAGTVIRLSTSTKWEKVGNSAFLQLSGWF